MHIKYTKILIFTFEKNDSIVNKCTVIFIFQNIKHFLFMKKQQCEFLLNVF